MYVCLCNGLTDRDIRAAARAGVGVGAGSVEEVYGRLGSEPICRCCVETAQSVIDEATSGEGRTAADARALVAADAA